MTLYDMLMSVAQKPRVFKLTHKRSLASAQEWFEHEKDIREALKTRGVAHVAKEYHMCYRTLKRRLGL